MRNFFFGAAAVAALAAPGIASAQQGYVGADYVNVDVDGAGSADAWGISGAAALSPNVAIDAGVLNNDEADATTWGATGHLFTNNSQYLFGGFVGFADNDVSTVWDVGAEAQAYMNNVTFAGAISYARDDDFDIDAWGINGEARYFFTDNFRVQGGLGWFNIDTPIGDDTATNVGVGGEFQFASAPVSVGLGYNHLSTDDTDIDADTVSATLRWNFGGSLRDRDHSGAGLAGLSGIGSALASM